MEAQLFKALGDPIRLKLVTRLADGSIHTVGTLTDGLDMSRQGARKHVDVLEAADIVALKPHGREVRVMLQPEALERGREFIARLERQWDARLGKLKDFVEATKD